MEKELAVIIPMNEFGDENIGLAEKAIKSVPDGIRVYLSVKKGTKETSLKGIAESVTKVSKSEGTSFQELVNAGVEAVKNDGFKWFSILEFDDEYTDIWLSNAKRYIDFMPETSVFMTLEDIVDFNDGRFIGFGNAEAYASSFSNEIGYIDNDCLQNYFDFYLTGSIFNVADWFEVGGLKPLMKLTFWYEWLLRLTSKGRKVFVMPKSCYIHRLGRKGSLVDVYKKTLSDEEVQWWFDMAKREYFYKEEREPEKYVYKPEEKEEE